MRYFVMIETPQEKIQRKGIKHYPVGLITADELMAIKNSCVQK